MSLDNRSEISGDARPCEYAALVKDPNGSVQIGACGEPSIAVWNWGDGDLPVCRDHDDLIAEEEFHSSKH